MGAEINGRVRVAQQEVRIEGHGEVPQFLDEQAPMADADQLDLQTRLPVLQLHRQRNDPGQDQRQIP